jgi:hypothetical protein
MRFRPALIALLTTLTLGPGLAVARPDRHRRVDPLAAWSRHARSVLSASMQAWLVGPSGANECGTLTDRAGQIFIELRKPSKADLTVLRATIKDFDAQDLTPINRDEILLHVTVAKAAIQRIASLRSVYEIDDAKCNHLSAD